ncbi:MAG: 2-oxo acid dehydrogenase subunit E2, partial [Candidatus Binatia bacterium]
MESPRDGRIHRWHVKSGDIIPINAPVLLIATNVADIDVHTGAIPKARLIPPRSREYAKTKGLSDQTLGDIPSVTDKLMPADIDAYLAKANGDSAVPTDYVQHKITGDSRGFIYRLRRSASTAIPSSITIEIPWEALRVDGVQTPGLRPTAFQVFSHAVARTARDHPKLRSVMSGDDHVREYDNVNIGLALARPNDGLSIAVIRAADTLTLSEFVRACTQQMRIAIRDGDQAADDIQVLLTHLGEFSIVDATPTLVAPASSVIFLGSPFGELRTSRVVMTFDHRLMNGAAAAAFLHTLANNLAGAAIVTRG